MCSRGEHIFEEWLCVGDFNGTLVDEDRLGGVGGNTSGDNAMREFMFQMGLIDLGAHGPQFTWDNRRDGSDNVRKRLDRAVCNGEWREVFEKAMVWNVVTHTSDHLALVIDTNGDREKLPRPFRFEIAWSRDESCVEVIENNWSEVVHGTGAFQLSKKLKSLKPKLRHWNKSKFGNYKQRIEEIKYELEKVHDEKGDTTRTDRMIFLQKELGEQLLREEISLWQKSRELKVQFGDGNNSYFHRSTITRRRKNFISWLQDRDGRWLKNRTDIGDHIIHEFKELYSSDHPIWNDEIDSLIFDHLTPEEKDNLSKIPDEEEIKVALFQMHPAKSPGPDGYPAFFYQHYWNQVAELGEIDVVERCLMKYQQWSGQSVNKEKSGVFFSAGMCDVDRTTLSHRWGFAELGSGGKYLGNPFLHQGSRKEAFKCLVERIKDRLEGWRCKSLSWAGRKTLIKSVVQSIPTYISSANWLPETICMQIDSLTRRFWWGVSNDKAHYLALTSWDDLCNPMDRGGLGFRKTRDFNVALLSKLAWQFAIGADKPWIQCLRHKYTVSNFFTEDLHRNNASWVWRAIEKSKGIIGKGACFIVGSGDNIRIWDDPWIPTLDNFRARPKDGVEVSYGNVNSLIENGSWNLNKLHELFDDVSIAEIIKLPLPKTPVCDDLVWVHTENGNFTVKSAYKVENASRWNMTNPIWKTIWTLKIPERLKTLLWRFCKGLLPLKSRLGSILHVDNYMCSLCEQSDSLESWNHLFLSCPWAKIAWRDSPWGLHSERWISLTPMEFLEELVHINKVVDSSDDIFLFASILIDMVWKCRNEKMFSSIKPCEPAIFAAKVKCRFLEYKELFRTDTLLPLYKVGCHPTMASLSPFPQSHDDSSRIMIKVDAAVRSTCSWAAAIAWDKNHVCMGAMSKKLPSIESLKAEADVIRCAMDWAANMNWQNVMIFSDAKVVIQAINSWPIRCNWRIWPIVLDIHKRTSNFVHVSWRWISRNENMEAHTLAARAARLCREGVSDFGPIM